MSNEQATVASALSALESATETNQVLARRLSACDDALRELVTRAATGPLTLATVCAVLAGAGVNAAHYGCGAARAAAAPCGGGLTLVNGKEVTNG